MIAAGVVALIIGVAELAELAGAEGGRAYGGEVWSSWSVDTTAHSVRYVGIVVEHLGLVASTAVLGILLVVTLSIVSDLDLDFDPNVPDGNNGQAVLGQLLWTFSPAYLVALISSASVPILEGRSDEIGPLIGTALGTIGYYAIVAGVVVPIAIRNGHKLNELRQAATGRRQGLDEEIVRIHNTHVSAPRFADTAARLEQAREVLVRAEQRVWSATALPINRGSFAIHLLLGALPLATVVPLFFG
jgi:hypothetical protein